MTAVSADAPPSAPCLSEFTAASPRPAALTASAEAAPSSLAPAAASAVVAAVAGPPATATATKLGEHAATFALAESEQTTDAEGEDAASAVVSEEAEDDVAVEDHATDSVTAEAVAAAVEGVEEAYFAKAEVSTEEGQAAAAVVSEIAPVEAEEADVTTVDCTPTTPPHHLPATTSILGAAADATTLDENVTTGLVTADAVTAVVVSSQAVFAEMGQAEAAIVQRHASAELGGDEALAEDYPVPADAIAAVCGGLRFSDLGQECPGSSIAGRLSSASDCDAAASEVPMTASPPDNRIPGFGLPISQGAGVYSVTQDASENKQAADEAAEKAEFEIQQTTVWGSEDAQGM